MEDRKSWEERKKNIASHPDLLKHYKSIRKLKISETFLIPLIIVLWVFLHGYYTKSYSYGIGKTLPSGDKF